MKKIVLTATVAVFGLTLATLSSAQVDQAACQKTIKNNCINCHSAKKICHELDESDANWPKIIKQMGEEGNLSQAVQDSALECLTKSADPKKLVCDK